MLATKGSVNPRALTPHHQVQRSPSPKRLNLRPSFRPTRLRRLPFRPQSAASAATRAHWLATIMSARQDRPITQKISTPDEKPFAKMGRARLAACALDGTFADYR